jgi:hypothetical protein
MARQIGTVLGVASLIAVLSRTAPGDPVDAFRRAVVMITAFMAGAGLVSGGLLTATPRTDADRSGLAIPKPPVAQSPADPGASRKPTH